MSNRQGKRGGRRESRTAKRTTTGRREPRASKGDKVQSFETVSATVVPPTGSEAITAPEQRQIPALTHERLPAVWEHVAGQVETPRAVHRIPAPGGWLYVVECEASSTSCFVPEPAAPSDQAVAVVQGQRVTLVAADGGIRQIATARTSELELDADLPELDLDDESDPSLEAAARHAPQAEQHPAPARVGAAVPRSDPRVVRRQPRAQAPAPSAPPAPSLSRDREWSEALSKILLKRLKRCPAKPDGWYPLSEILGPRPPHRGPVWQSMGLDASDGPGLEVAAAKEFHRLGFTIEDGSVYAPDKQPGRGR